VKDLNYYSFRDAFSREKILAKLGPELTADLYVNRSWHDRPPTVMREDLSDQENQGDSDDDDDDDMDDGPDNSVTQDLGEAMGTRGNRAAQDILAWVSAAHDSREAVNGSNDWVVSGSHTVSGKPLLSNDMHLGHQMPNLWYEAHLKLAGKGSESKSDNLDVAGVTLPGVPYVIVGHNQRIAWGFTNVGPTVTDGYIENFNAQGEYQTPQGWRQPEHRAEIIHVKGKPDVTFDVRITRHGPIVSDLLPGETRQVALRWTLYDGLHMMFFDVDTAQNLCRRGRQHRLSNHGARSDPRQWRWQLAGQRRRRYPRMDRLHSIRQTAQHLQPAIGSDRDREWANHARWLSVFDQRGVGSALAHGTHLSRFGIGQTVHSRRYAGAAKRYSLGKRFVRGRAFCLRRGSC
jgi:hypothetical protein